MASIRIFGNVTAPDFPIWIKRHATKLGLRKISTALQSGTLVVTASGPDEMLDALAVACSLGPKSTLVERVTLDHANPDSSTH